MPDEPVRWRLRSEVLSSASNAPPPLPLPLPGDGGSGVESADSYRAVEMPCAWAVYPPLVSYGMCCRLCVRGREGAWVWCADGGGKSVVVGLELGLKEWRLWNELGSVMAEVYRDVDVADVGDVINIGGFSFVSHSSGGKLGTKSKGE